MNIYGIDTNHHHPITSWASVAAWLKRMNNGGPGFDMVRLGYSSRSGKGGLILDNIALTSLKTCNKLGIPVGVYVYCYDTTPAAAEKTARDVIAAIKSYKIEYPVAYDMEYGTHDGRSTGYKYDNKANAANNTAIVAAALKAI